MIRLRAAPAVVFLALAAACGTNPSGRDAGPVTCPDGTVDTGAGCALRRPLGQACSAATECASGYCTDGVCCESACGGPCVTCNANGGCEPLPLRTPEPVCGTYVCGLGRCETSCTQDAQCSADAHCESRECQGARGAGSLCTADNQCESHHCADGYCCDQACAGACEACDRAGTLGTCGPVAAGSAGVPTCGAFLCSGLGSACPAACTTDADCAANHHCDAQRTCAPKKAVGTVCVVATECLSNFCTDGYCCDGACLGGCDVCNAAGNEGTCRLAAAGAAGAPSCFPLVCSGTNAACPPSCASDFQCAAGRFCSAGGCQLQRANGGACAAGRECQSGFCADGVCCDQACGGQCDACNQLGTVGQCTLLGASALGNPPCSPYSCNGTTPNCGLACTTAGPGAPCATTEWCDGVVCTQKGAPGQSCTATWQCLSGQCADGVCCDTACSGACDACDERGKEGTCTPRPLGTAALVCGNYVCDGATSSCPSACSADAHCLASTFCDGNQCLPRRPQGQSCARDGACVSNHCADGLCCDAVCGNACDACDRLGLEGVCGPAPSGATPDPACGLLVCNGLFSGCPAACGADADCVQGAWCDTGTCRPQRALGETCARDRMCAQGHCADGYCCDQACGGACDTCGAQPGTCLPMGAGSVGVPACNGLACDGASPDCPLVCNLNSDCVSGHYCNGPGGSCVPRQPDGAVCGSDNAACLSGFCTDGRCCNTACNGACEACDVNPGTCTAATAGTSGAPSCAPYICNGASGDCPTACPTGSEPGRGCITSHYCEAQVCTPKKPAGQGCFDAAQCASGFCVDGVCCGSACGGPCDVCNLVPGTCTATPAGAPGSPTCFPYTCGGSASTCPTSCSVNGDCATNTCALSVCQKRALAEACAASFECASACCDRDALACTAGPSNCL